MTKLKELLREMKSKLVTIRLAFEKADVKASVFLKPGENYWNATIDQYLPKEKYEDLEGRLNSKGFQIAGFGTQKMVFALWIVDYYAK